LGLPTDAVPFLLASMFDGFGCAFRNIEGIGQSEIAHPRAFE
jgi:hypothetical protein